MIILPNRDLSAFRIIVRPSAVTFLFLLRVETVSRFFSLIGSWNLFLGWIASSLSSLNYLYACSPISHAFIRSCITSSGASVAVDILTSFLRSIKGLFQLPIRLSTAVTALSSLTFLVQSISSWWWDGRFTWSMSLRWARKEHLYSAVI